MKMQKEQKEVTEKLAKLKEQPDKPQKQEKQETVPPDDEDKVLYCDTDDNNSLPDPFASQDTKKVKTSDIKDQAEDKATGTSDVMDTTDMPKLISDEEDELTKKFTFKKPTGPRSHRK